MPIVSIIMFILTGALLLFAGITALSKNIPFLFQQTYSIPEGEKGKKYSVQFAKLLTLIAVSPLVSAILGLFVRNVLIVVIVFVVLFVGLMVLGVKTVMKGFY